MDEETRLRMSPDTVDNLSHWYPGGLHLNTRVQVLCHTRVLEHSCLQCTWVLDMLLAGTVYTQTWQTVPRILAVHQPGCREPGSNRFLDHMDPLSSGSGNLPSAPGAVWSWNHRKICLERRQGFCSRATVVLITLIAFPHGLATLLCVSPRQLMQII